MTEPELRRGVRQFLFERNLDALSALMVKAAFAGLGDAAERIAREELAVTPHEVHQWWDGPCDCMN